MYVIDAMEKRDVATVDIPGAFMPTDMNEVVHMRLDEEMANLVAQLDPELYNKYTTYENGVPVINVVLLKALHGTIWVGLLFWQKTYQTLNIMGTCN